MAPSDGGLAAQVGPLIADDTAIAAALLARAVDGLEGPLFVDLADSKQEVRSLLDARGFTEVLVIMIPLMFCALSVAIPVFAYICR